MIEPRRSASTDEPAAPVKPRGDRTRRGVNRPAEADRLAELESRLASLERSPGLRERGRGLMARVIPAEATQHFRNAGREQLLGLRSIVDFWIDRIDKSEERSGAGPRRESIEVE